MVFTLQVQHVAGTELKIDKCKNWKIELSNLIGAGTTRSWYGGVAVGHSARGEDRSWMVLVPGNVFVFVFVSTNTAS